DPTTNAMAINLGRLGCVDPQPGEPTVTEVPLSTIRSLRTLLRLTPSPEFGDTLLDLLESEHPLKPPSAGSHAAMVQRGAILFGVDLVAFANRMIPDRMPTTGDGLDPHAINQKNRWLDCVGCHTPIQKTGQSPAEVGAGHLSFVWFP